MLSSIFLNPWSWTLATDSGTFHQQALRVIPIHTVCWKSLPLMADNPVQCDAPMVQTRHESWMMLSSLSELFSKCSQATVHSLV